MATTTTLHTPRFRFPVPTWNADWQKWQQVFETFATSVDSTLFALLEHGPFLPSALPTVTVTGGVFSQSGVAKFVSRTMQVELSVGPNDLALTPGAIVCAPLLSGAVGPQSVDWELRLSSVEVDADLVALGVVGDDYSIYWFNGAHLPVDTPMALFAHPGGGGGGGLSPAPFDFVTVPTLLTAAQNGQYFFSVGAPYGNGTITLPAAPTGGMQFTIMCMGTGITVDGNGSPMAGPMGLAWGALVLGLESETVITVTAKDLDPLMPGTFAWVVTSGAGEIFNDADPTQRFNFNFNVPTTFPVDATAEFLGWGAAGIVRTSKTEYGIRRAPNFQLPGGALQTVGPTHIWNLIESGRSDATGTTPVECTLDGFAFANDDGWECEFLVGVDAAQDPVPMQVQCLPFTDEICIQAARYVNSIISSDVGAFVRLRWAPYGLGRGHFIVTGGRGTWTDNYGGVHQLTGGGGGASSLQDAYDGGSEIVIPGGGDPVTVTNNRAGAPAIEIGGTGPQRIAALDDLEITDGNYAGVEGPPDALPLTDAGARDFLFPCASLVDAINKAYLGAAAVAWAGTTTNDTPTEIFVGGVASERYVMPEGSTTVFQLTAVARDNTGNRSKAWDIVGLAQVSIGGTPSWVSLASPAYAVIDQTDPSGGTDDWDVALSLELVDRSMRVTVTGQTGTNIQWAVFRR